MGSWLKIKSLTNQRVLLCFQNFDPTKSSPWTQLRWSIRYLRPLFGTWMLTFKLGRLLFDQKFRINVWNGGKWCGQWLGKLTEFPRRTIQRNILEISGANSNGTETLGEKFSKMWLYLLRLCSFPKNVVPFGTVKFWKIKRAFLVEWKASLNLEEFWILSQIDILLSGFAFV